MEGKAGHHGRNQRHQEEERDLKDRLAQLYAPWGDDLSILDGIATDGVQKESLRQDVEKHKNPNSWSNYPARKYKSRTAWTQSKKKRRSF